MTVNNQPNVFWYNETDRYIYRYDGSAVDKYMMWHAPGAIVSFLGYTKDLCKKYTYIPISLVPQASQLVCCCTQTVGERIGDKSHMQKTVSMKTY